MAADTAQTDLEAMKEVFEEARETEEDARNSSSSFTRENDENLVKWQLELDNILERIDHIIRGHKLEWINGNFIWTETKDEKDMIFNKYGASEIMRILSMYLNRNTILSNYDVDQVELKVYDFGIEVSDLIMNKYEDMGLDTEEKMVRYPMIIRELIDIIHSAYLRALNGEERESLREARTVLQTIPMQNTGMPMAGQGQARSIFNPARYIAGKYK